MDYEDLDDALKVIGVLRILCEVKKKRLARKKRRFGVMDVWRRRKALGDGDNLIEELRFNAPLFFKYTRMNYERFDYLLGLCNPYLQKRLTKVTIPPKQRLAMTLRFLATGDSMSSISFAYRCGFATVSVIIQETLSVIVHVLHRLVVCEPRSQNDWRDVADGFLRRWNLPNCLGAIDGRHMVIKAPQASGSKYFNYEKTHSIVLLAVADSDYTFITADVGAEGSHSDSAILNQSKFWQRVKTNTLHIPPRCLLPGSNIEMPYFFAGDGIFQLQENLLKPFARKLTMREAVYNYRLSRARRVVENAFGILVMRWQVFRSPMCCTLETAENIVLATVCLHNFIMRSRENRVLDNYVPPGTVDVEQEDGTLIPGEWREMIVGENGALQPLPAVPKRCTKRATEIRKDLMRYLNGVGAVPLQEKKVRNGFWGAHVTADIS